MLSRLCIRLSRLLDRSRRGESRASSYFRPDLSARNSCDALVLPGEMLMFEANGLVRKQQCSHPCAFCHVDKCLAIEGSALDVQCHTRRPVHNTFVCVESCFLRKVLITEIENRPPSTLLILQQLLKQQISHAPYVLVDRCRYGEAPYNCYRA